VARRDFGTPHGGYEGCRTQSYQKPAVPGRAADFKSWLPIAIAAIVVLPLYYVITGRCSGLLNGGQKNRKLCI
jgi:hypothetical protein